MTNTHESGDLLERGSTTRTVRWVQVVATVLAMLMASAGVGMLGTQIDVVDGGHSGGEHYCGTAFSVTTGQDWGRPGPGAGDGEPHRQPSSQEFRDTCHDAARTRAWVGFGLLGLAMALALVAGGIAVVRVSRWFAATRSYYPTR